MTCLCNCSKQSFQLSLQSMETTSKTTMILPPSTPLEEHRSKPDLDTRNSVMSSAEPETPSASGDFDDISVRELQLKNIELRQQIIEMQGQLKKLDDLHVKRNETIQFYEKVFA